MNENNTEHSGRQSGRQKIPVAVIVIACLYLAVGVVGFVAHFQELRASDGILVELTELLAIVCGVFLLRAQNWARWLAIAWMAFHVALSFGVWRQLAIHGLFLLLIAGFLLRADANRFFKSAQASQ